MCVASKLGRTLWRVLAEEDGPTATEYAVLLGLILLVAIGTITVFGQTLNAAYGTINTALSP
jgi:pilus assembly protein Flp/PilA